MNTRAYDQLKELLTECGFNPINMDQSISIIEKIVLDGQQH